VFYAWDITIPAGTPETDPVERDLEVTKGVVTRIDIKFPPGCHGLVKVRLLRYGSQLIPLSRGEWVTGDGEAVETEGYYPMEEEPLALRFVGCSPQTAYPHTITVRVQVTPHEIASPWQTLREFVKIMKRLMGI